MSTLVVLLEPRRRLRAGATGDGADAAPDAGTEWTYATTADGLFVTAQGRAAAALLPREAATVAVLADGDVSWHRLVVPKAGAGKMRAALAGALEEQLLEDADDVHLALAPQAAPGQVAWVAAVNRRWLRGELAVLERAGIVVDRVVPSAWPDAPPTGHFAEAAADGAAPGLMLHWSHPDGTASLPIHGALARALLPQPTLPGVRWTASPAVAAAAEAWLGAPVAVQPAAERALQAMRSLWNLRQFDLAPRRRGTRALRQAWQRFLGKPWRPVRIGLVALAAIHVVGLNLWAWHLRGQVDDRRAARLRVVQQAFPTVNPIDVQRNALGVMQREVRAVRARSGRLGDDDLETLLGAAAGAWPTERGPVTGVRYEPGRLTLVSTPWTAPQLDRLRATLQPAGWQVDVADGGNLTLRRAAGAAR